VTHLGMAAAWNGNAADHGTSNLWLRSGGSLRVTLLLGRRAGRYHRECKHNGRNNGYDCFHRDPPSRLNKAMPANFARALLRPAAVLPTAPAIILAARPTSPVALEWEAEAVVVAIVVVPEVVVRSEGIVRRLARDEAALGLVVQHRDKLGAIVGLGAQRLVRDDDRGSRQGGRRDATEDILRDGDAIQRILGIVGVIDRHRG